MPFWRRRKSKFEEPRDEPLFSAVSRTDPAMQEAHARAAHTMPEFEAHVGRPGEHVCSAKLRFRDPNESERAGTDVLLYLWLTAVTHDAGTGTYTGTFFEVPPALQEWHRPGQRLRFDPDDVFDWMVNEDGTLHGGFTLRVSRNRVPESERAAFDDYIGVRHWVQRDRQ